MKIKLRNEFIDYMDRKELKFVPGNKVHAENVMNRMVDTLWYIDPRRNTFQERSVNLPFKEFEGYFNWKAQKKSKPKVCECSLIFYIFLRHIS